MSTQPVNRLRLFHVDWPWRTKTSLACGFTVSPVAVASAKASDGMATCVCGGFLLLDAQQVGARLPQSMTLSEGPGSSVMKAGVLEIEKVGERVQL